MPKEIVKGRWPIIGTPERPEIEGLVQVGWDAESEHCQVVTLSRVVVTHETSHEGLYVDLDRRGINELIRNLRRARDQAFGRDE